MRRELTWSFGPFRLNGTLLYRSTKDGVKLLKLEKRDAPVLMRLLEAWLRPVSREELLRELGPKAEVPDPNNVDQSIRRIRSALGDTGGGGKRSDRQYQYISTVPRQGYAFVYDGLRVEEPIGVLSRVDCEVGRILWNDRVATSLREAKGRYDGARRRDPHYPTVYADLADLFVILASYLCMSPGDGARNAMVMANQSLRLGGSLHQPTATLGFVKSLFEHRWEEATRYFLQSIDEKEDYGTAHHWYGLRLAATGDWMTAIEQISIARKYDPSPIIEAHTAAILYWARLFDLAEEQCDRATAVEYHPTFWYLHHLLGLVYEQRGRVEEARVKQHHAVKFYREAQMHSASAADSDPDQSALLGAALARAHALCGDLNAAAHELEKLRALPRQRAAHYHTAAAYAAVGSMNTAFAHLQSACEHRDVWASFLAVDPRFDVLRRDIRLSSVYRELDLPSAAAMAPKLSRKDITMVRDWLEL